jgi:hypothetical protein
VNDDDQLRVTVKDLAVGAGISAYLITLVWCLYFLASGVLFGR